MQQDVRHSGLGELEVEYVEKAARSAVADHFARRQRGEESSRIAASDGLECPRGAEVQAPEPSPNGLGRLATGLEERGGFWVGAWCGDAACEAEISAKTKATIRFLPLEPADPGAACVHCGKPGTEVATWARAY